MKTGRTFPFRIVAKDRTTGKICIGCGKYGVRFCEDCEKLDKCKLCGILARKVYKHFSYLWKKGISIEVLMKYPPVCKELEDGFCQGCIAWEYDVLDYCIKCKQPKTDKESIFSYYKAHGNVCTKCERDFEAKFKKSYYRYYHYGL